MRTETDSVATESAFQVSSRGIALAAVAVLTILAYLPSLRGPFIWDGEAITGNVLLRSPEGLLNIWLRPSLNANEAHYWPVTYTVLWGAYQLWGLNTTAYHLLNLALHLANSGILLLLLRRLRVPGALLAASLFAVHPIHVEVVSWIIQLKELLAALLALLSTLFFVRAAPIRWHSPGKEDGLPASVTRLLALSALAYLLAILSKSSALPLPICLALICWWRSPQWRTGYIFAAAMLLPGITLGVGDLLFSRREALPISVPLPERLLIAMQAIWFYVGRLVAPFQVQPLWAHLRADPITAALSLLAITAVLASLLGFRKRGAFAATASYLLFLAPILGLVEFGFHRFSNVADRFQYLASVPGTAACGALLSVLGQRLLTGRIQLAVAGALLVLLGSQTARQSRLWSDPLLFWKSAHAVVPKNPEVVNNLGKALDSSGFYQEAEQAYRKALALDPENSRVHLNLGAALARQGHLKEAKGAYREALRLRPDYPEAHNNLGLLHQQQGDVAAAAKSYHTAIQADPTYSNARLNLALLLLSTGKLEEGKAELRQLLQIDPAHAGALQLLKRLGGHSGNS